MSFGRWQPLGSADVPDAPGLLQLRFGEGRDGLVDYPTGKSAMAYYAADDASARAALERIRARATPGEAARLWVRYAPASAREAPTEALKESLRAFEQRFGSPPILHRDWV